MPGNGGGLHVTGADTVVVIGGTVTGNTAAAEGGGLWNNGGYMSVTGTIIRNNTATGNAADNGGGGIFNNGGDMDIIAVIRSNQATGTSGSGGGLFSTDGDINVTLTNLDSNSANRAGGAVEIINGTFDFDGRSTMLYNDVNGTAGAPNPGNGGGVHVTGTGAVTISDIQVGFNEAGREGGGLWNQNGATMTLNNVLINDNVANGSAVDDGGGGVFNNGGTVNINAGTVITDNDALNGLANGGGVMTLAGTVTISGATVSNNNAARAGGGIENTNGMVTLNNVIADSNYAGINGGGVHVSGTGTTDVFGGTFSKNVADQEGGGLWNASGTMTIDGTTIDGNTANASNNGGNDQGGGGVFNIGGTLNIDNSSITNNNALLNLGNGGGVMTDGGTVAIVNSTISGNACARAGGGIENFNGLITISSSTVGGATVADGNIAGINGGGIHVSGTGNTDVIGGMFKNNVAQQEGGGLWNGSGLMTIDGTTVEANVANAANNGSNNQGGGGVFNAGGTITIDNALITDNTAPVNAGNGGGLMTDGGTVTIDSSSFSKNSAARAGGAIENFDGTVTITESRFGGMVPAEGNMAGINGGAIHVSVNGTTDVINSAFRNNVAQREGGGLWNNTGTMMVSGSTIDANEANGVAADDGGGGIFNNGGTLKVMSGTVISNNTATNGAGSGGGIQNHAGGTLTVVSSTISGNSASRAGGGIEGSASGGKIVLTNVNLDNNITGSSPGNGGGLHVTSNDTVMVTGGTVNGNIAAREGGGLWNNGGFMKVDGTSISANDANGKESNRGGGGIFNNGGTLEVSNASLVSNTANDSLGSGGGIFNNVGGSVTVMSSLFDNNSSSRAGGGIEDQSGTGVLTLTDVTMTFNGAGSMPGNGGAVHITGGATTNISGGSYNSNAAGRDGGALWNGSGLMIITEATINDNEAYGAATNNGGGGIWNNGGSIVVSRSTVSANRADQSNANGGGIYNAFGTLDVEYSTISGNSANNEGGGIYNVGTANISASTIANNSATEGGGIDQGILVSNLTTLDNTIVADNSASGLGQDLNTTSGGYASGGYNLIEQDDANVFFPLATDIEGQDPNLGPLADNGGATFTHAVMCPSPAVNAGDPGLNTMDQRGFAVFGGSRDIGSFELQSACPVGAVVCNSYVTDGTWMKSTTVTPSNLSGIWSGVNGNLPANGTFTMNAMVGQPYGFTSIDSIDGAKVLKTGRDITYFRKTIMIDSLQNFEARVRLLVDDQAEVYVNGKLLVGQYTGGRSNYKLPSFDAMFNNDNTVDNPNGGGVAYDATSSMDLDNIFKVGMNTITVAVRNYAKASDKGGFTMRLDLCGEKINGALPTMDSLVSSNGFEKSTVVTQSNFSGFWAGVNSLPANSTYTLQAVEGQPYSFASIDAVPGSKVITTQSNNIVYYRREFSLTSSSNLSARLRMTVDDGMEIYINGQLIAREENVARSNFKAPSHDVKFNANGTVSNGFMGGDMFDFTTLASMDDVFNTGVNELVVVVRNLGKASDRGGFSFRMEVESNGSSVLVADKKTAVASGIAASENGLQAEVYPNPSSGNVNVYYEAAGYELMIFDMNGKMIDQQQVDGQNANLDISTYAAGVYFVKIKSGDKVITQKLIKE